MKVRKLFLALLPAMLFALPACSDDEPAGTQPEPPISQPEGQAPVVKTFEAAEVSETTVSLSGEVVSDNDYRVIERGFVYSDAENPDVDNAEKIVEGRGTGEYSVVVRNLQSNKTYYFRAYAVNSQGTAYGEEHSFTTLPQNVLNININGVILKMVLVNGGTFNMGATEEQGSDGQSAERPVHKVTLDDYYIGLCEVTNEVWTVVENGRVPTLEENPTWTNERFMPKAMVSYDECLAFIEKLNVVTGYEFSLPTEAQWEYAARGGKYSCGYKYPGGDDYDTVGWCYENSETNVAIVGTKSPNELGLYDMMGNVLEWCADWYGSYLSEDQTNPTGPATGSYRVMRGGSVINLASECRVSQRFGGEPNSHFFFVGFRLALKVR